jgi:quinol monooxygenase YgiN
MANLVEMDEKVTLKDQMEDEVSGPVILISKFNVEHKGRRSFLKIWEENATNFKREPGFISTQLHKGTGNSSVFISYAVWESPKHVKNAADKVLGPDLQLVISKFPDSLVHSSHLFKKIAVPGICGD